MTFVKISVINTTYSAHLKADGAKFFAIAERVGRIVLTMNCERSQISPVNLSAFDMRPGTENSGMGCDKRTIRSL